MAVLLALALPVVIGAGVGIALGIEHHDKHHKREASELYEPQGMIFRLERTNLPNHDFSKLFELNVTRSGFRVEALFTTRDFEDTDVRGMRQGHLSFSVPGFEGPVHGTWIAIDHENADAQTMAEFKRDHQIIMDALHDGVDDMLDLVQKLAETGSALVDAAALEV